MGAAARDHAQDRETALRRPAACTKESPESALLAAARGRPPAQVFEAFRRATSHLVPAGAMQLQAIERRVCLVARAWFAESSSPPALLHAAVSGLRDGLRVASGRTEDPVLDKLFRNAIDKAVAACEAEVPEAVLVTVKTEALRPDYPSRAQLRTQLPPSR